MAFLQITLPLLVVIMVAAWLNNRRIDEVSRRFDDVNHRFDDVNRRIDDLRQTLLPMMQDLHRIVLVHERRLA